MGKMYENIPRVKRVVVYLNKHSNHKVTEAILLGGFTDDEAK